MLAALPLLPNYLKTFRYGGACAFWRVYGPKRNCELFSVSVGRERFRLRNTVSDRSIFFQIIVQREYETRHWPALHDRLERSYHRLLAEGRTPIIIDAGANIGLSARWFALRYPESRIYAIEPDPSNAAVLRQNTEHCPNITLLEGALWDRPASLHIGNPHDGAASLRASEGQGDITAYTVAEIMRQDRGALFIAKIDIEGGEEAVFRDNSDWLSDVKLTIIELHDWLYPGEGTSRNFIKEISKQPVDIVFRGENLFCFRVSYDTGS